MAKKKKSEKDFLKDATPEDLAMVEYIKKHSYIDDFDLPIKLSINEFDRYVKILYEQKSDIKEIEKAIMVLAHLDERDKAREIFEDIKKYNVIKDERLKIWIDMAIDELKEDISIGDRGGKVKIISIKVPESLKYNPEFFLDYLKEKVKEKKQKNKKKKKGDKGRSWI
ncbi:MAG TPA: hypothetical protein PLD27_02460 [bacterium]|nr:hypothetical protein [bacterium]HOL47560.1 hypothetical protein [bacterium]HPQ18452.1 hypothetical protein [bacterium]